MNEFAVSPPNFQGKVSLWDLITKKITLSTQRWIVGKTIHNFQNSIQVMSCFVRQTYWILISAGFWNAERLTLKKTHLQASQVIGANQMSSLHNLTEFLLHSNERQIYWFKKQMICVFCSSAAIADGKILCSFASLKWKQLIWLIFCNFIISSKIKLNS